MREYYKPTEKFIIRNYELYQFTQMPNEKCSAFYNIVEVAGKICLYCECTKGCCTEEYAIRNQIVIGTTNDTIRESNAQRLELNRFTDKRYEV